MKRSPQFIFKKLRTASLLRAVSFVVEYVAVALEIYYLFDWTLRLSGDLSHFMQTYFDFRSTKFRSICINFRTLFSRHRQLHFAI
jgi:hypothetical protein